MSLQLKQKREALNLDIKEISSIIRVRENFLRAIENEQYDDMPLEIYARGYIKLYAKYLDFPYEQAIEPFENYISVKTGRPVAIPVSQSSSTLPADTEKDFLKGREDIHIEPKEVSFDSPREKSAKPRYRIAITLLTALILVFVLGFAFYYFALSDFANNEGSKKNSVPKPQSKPPVATAQTAKQMPPSQDAAQPANQTQPSQDATQPAPSADQIKAPAVSNGNKTDVVIVPDKDEENKPADSTVAGKAQALKPYDNPNSQRRRHVLVVSATEQTKVQLLIDGNDTVDISLAPGESRTLYAFRSFSAFVPDSGSVKLKFNGKSLPQGKKGESRSFNLPLR
jgi:cytoskeleton protein RodZ